ncbi:MAG: DUF962 domain-containing protein [Vicinamibacteria bacterium]|jgi:hypothetical protein|nr:DUF962 domain-containing protein [Vicinamibacteria bacterium]
MPSEPPTSYREFWPFYVSQHLHPVNRMLHAVGTTCVIAIVAGAALTTPGWMGVAPVAGYGFAWLGHLVFERNRPATFRHPLWSLIGDFHMYALMLLGQMKPELEYARRLYPDTAAAFDSRGA